MELNLTPEDVNKLVKETIMESTIGKVIIDSVKKALSASYDNPIDLAIKGYVKQIAEEVVKEQFHEQIKLSVTKTIEEKVTPELITTVVEASVNKMVRAAEEARW